MESQGTLFSASFEVDIIEDRLGWSGMSPLLVSFYAPAWMLLLQPRTASVEFSIQSTPQSTRAFVGSLGLQLTIGDLCQVRATEAEMRVWKQVDLKGRFPDGFLRTLHKGYMRLRDACYPPRLKPGTRAG